VKHSAPVPATDDHHRKILDTNVSTTIELSYHEIEKLARSVTTWRAV